MSMEPSQLLSRISSTLKNDVGPAVGDEYTRTQTHMASVILGKVAKQIALADIHTAAEQADVAQLHQDLAEPLATAPGTVTEAAETAASAGTVASLGRLIEALYAWGLDSPGAARALDLIRVTLRNDIDRRMEIAQ